MIDDATLTELRRLAEAATQEHWGTPLGRELNRSYVDAAHPGTVIALLDEVERRRSEAWRVDYNARDLEACAHIGLAGDEKMARETLEQVPALARELERLRAIVKDMAAIDEPLKTHNWCMLCDTHGHPDHAESCPYRRAVEAVKP